MPYSVAARNAGHREAAARWLRGAGVPEDLAERIARRMPGRDAKALAVANSQSVEDARRIGGLVQRLYDTEQERDRLRAAIMKVCDGTIVATGTAYKGVSVEAEDFLRAALRAGSEA